MLDRITELEEAITTCDGIAYRAAGVLFGALQGGLLDSSPQTKAVAGEIKDLFYAAKARVEELRKAHGN